MPPMPEIAIATRHDWHPRIDIQLATSATISISRRSPCEQGNGTRVRPGSAIQMRLPRSRRSQRMSNRNGPERQAISASFQRTSDFAVKCKMACNSRMEVSRAILSSVPATTRHTRKVSASPTNCPRIVAAAVGARWKWPLPWKSPRMLVGRAGP